MSARRPWLVASALVLVAALAPASGAQSSGVLAVISPTTFVDDNTDNGNCTLREAIIAANTDAAEDACPAGAGADEIRLKAGTYELAVPGAPEEQAATGDLDILGPDGLTITGDPDGSTVDANGIDRVFQLLDGANATFELLTISGGMTATGDFGGGVAVNESTATIIDSTIAGNTAGADGGGIDTFGDSSILNVIDSTVSGNKAVDDGGGFDLDDGTVTISNSTISGNEAGDEGGALDAGGGPEDSFTISNSTITANSALFGGGIETAPSLSLRGTIVAGNTAPAGPDCEGFTSIGFNLVQDATGCTIIGQQATDIVGEDPLLGPLADNGGPTWTHALGEGSPAIDAGPPDAPTTDQRGAPRNPDIGAYEFVTCKGALVNRVGTPGPDDLTGTGAADAFLLLEGNDRASGLGGADAFCCDAGNDRLVGGGGNDKLVGLAGDDTLNGGSGRDTLNGGKGDDTCNGGGGSDKGKGCEEEKQIP